MSSTRKDPRKVGLPIVMFFDDTSYNGEYDGTLIKKVSTNKWEIKWDVGEPTQTTFTMAHFRESKPSKPSRGEWWISETTPEEPAPKRVATSATATTIAIASASYMEYEIRDSRDMCKVISTTHILTTKEPTPFDIEDPPRRCYPIFDKGVLVYFMATHREVQNQQPSTSTSDVPPVQQTITHFHYNSSDIHVTEVQLQRNKAYEMELASDITNDVHDSCDCVKKRCLITYKELARLRAQKTKSLVNILDPRNETVRDRNKNMTPIKVARLKSEMYQTHVICTTHAEGKKGVHVRSSNKSSCIVCHADVGKSQGHSTRIDTSNRKSPHFGVKCKDCILTTSKEDKRTFTTFIRRLYMTSALPNIEFTVHEEVNIINFPGMVARPDFIVTAHLPGEDDDKKVTHVGIHEFDSNQHATYRSDELTAEMLFAASEKYPNAKVVLLRINQDGDNIPKRPPYKQWVVGNYKFDKDQSPDEIDSFYDNRFSKQRGSGEMEIAKKESELPRQPKVSSMDTLTRLLITREWFRDFIINEKWWAKYNVGYLFYDYNSRLIDTRVFPNIFVAYDAPQDNDTDNADWACSMDPLFRKTLYGLKIAYVDKKDLFPKEYLNKRNPGCWEEMKRKFREMRDAADASL